VTRRSPSAVGSARTARLRARRAEVLAELSDRLRTVVEAQLARSATPPALLVALGRDGRLRAWPIPRNYPQSRPDDLRATSELLRSLMARVNPLAYGLVVTVPAEPADQDRSVRDWARAAGLEDRPTVIHVSDGMASFTVGARLHSVNGGSPEFLAWHGAPALAGPFNELEAAVAPRSASRPMAAAAT
jgi:hypothetical protein